MSPFAKIIVFLVLAVVVYALWPRQPALDRFNPAKLSEEETAAWRAIREQQGVAALARYYLIYDQQYGFSPVSALTMAQQRAGATAKILKSPDEADMEANIPALVEFFVLVKRETGADFDAAVAGRSDYTLWADVAQKAWGEGLASSVSNVWSQIYNVPPASLLPAAKLRASALEKAFSGSSNTTDWNAVRSLLAQSYELLKAQLPPSK